MSEPELRVGTTNTSRIRFLQEGMDQMVDIHLAERKWDVTNPEARLEAFRDAMGEEVDDWWSRHATWYINAEKNTAALAIYRYKTPKNLREWEERKVAA